MFDAFFVRKTNKIKELLVKKEAQNFASVYFFVT